VAIVDPSHASVAGAAAAIADLVATAASSN
jgi:hypothetical protein